MNFTELDELNELINNNKKTYDILMKSVNIMDNIEKQIEENIIIINKNIETIVIQFNKNIELFKKISALIES